MDIKQLNKNIRSIGQRGKNLDNLIQDTAIGGIAHAIEHGNNTPLTMLVCAMPKSSRQKALIKLGSFPLIQHLIKRLKKAFPSKKIVIISLPL